MIRNGTLSVIALLMLIACGDDEPFENPYGLPGNTVPQLELLAPCEGDVVTVYSADPCVGEVGFACVTAPITAITEQSRCGQTLDGDFYAVGGYRLPESRVFTEECTAQYRQCENTASVAE